MEFTFDTLPEAVKQLHIELNEIKKLILENNQLPNDVWYDVDELCVYHPENPAKATVYSWVKNRKIPFHKSGKKLIFLKSEIDDYLKKGRQKTISEIKVEADTFLTKQKRRAP